MVKIEEILTEEEISYICSKKRCRLEGFLVEQINKKKIFHDQNILENYIAYDYQNDIMYIFNDNDDENIEFKINLIKKGFRVRSIELTENHSYIIYGINNDGRYTSKSVKLKKIEDNKTKTIDQDNLSQKEDISELLDICNEEGISICEFKEWINFIIFKDEYAPFKVIDFDIFSINGEEINYFETKCKYPTSNGTFGINIGEKKAMDKLKTKGINSYYLILLKPIWKNNYRLSDIFKNKKQKELMIYIMSNPNEHGFYLEEKKEAPSYTQIYSSSRQVYYETSVSNFIYIGDLDFKINRIDDKIKSFNSIEKINMSFLRNNQF